MIKTKSGKVWATEAVKDSIHPMWQHSSAQFQLYDYVIDVFVIEFVCNFVTSNSYWEGKTPKMKI
jgi:hypothetical protein